MYIQTNFIGLGLPSYLFYQLYELMAEAIHTEFNGATTLTCSTIQGGNCVLNQPCAYFTD